MAIDAVISAVTIRAKTGPCTCCHDTGKDPETNWDTCPLCFGITEDCPVVHVHFQPREKDGSAGQKKLRLINPPSMENKFYETWIGIEVWSTGTQMMMGSTKFADRIGYAAMRLTKGKAT